MRSSARTSASASRPAPVRSAPVRRAPSVGFVSLGCPKALVDSERLITALRSRGYGIAAGYAGADLVVVNTCGFIDAAIDESLQAIGEALEQHGRVLVTGCLGANPQRILERHPRCWESPVRTPMNRFSRPSTSTCRNRTIRSWTWYPPRAYG